MKAALLIAALLAAPSASAQDADLPAPYVDPAAAAPRLLELVAAHPDRMDLRLAAARELTALGILEPTLEERASSLREAVATARAAVALDSASADARYRLAAALGLAADQAGGLSKISFAREAYAETEVTLALDPDHGGAHHILGRLHAGALRLGRLNRLIARGLGLGEILSTASWESAERHLRIALERDPDPLVHTVELAKLLLRRERWDEGRALLTEVAGRTARHPLDEHSIAEARTLLAGDAR